MHHLANRLMPTAVLAGMAGCAVVALLFAATILVVAPQQAAATPAYAQQTGLACGRCHANKAGGGKLTAFGAKFKASGHKLPK
jgi:cytochrome c553